MGANDHLFGAGRNLATAAEALLDLDGNGKLEPSRKLAGHPLCLISCACRLQS